MEGQLRKSDLKSILEQLNANMTSDKSELREVEREVVNNKS